MTTATITASDFEFIADLVRREAAIVLEPGKEYLAENRLHPVARKEGIESISALVDRLRRGAPELREKVVDALTTNETSFFRDGHPWEAIRTDLLPQLIERRKDTRMLTVWCAASSSGQEPFTLAMLLREHFAAALDGWTVRIISTDISPTMIERCKRGRYSQLEVNRGLPAMLLVKHFTRAGTEWELNQDVRSMVEFRLMNLADPEHYRRLPMLDLVLIRNVLIYFDLDTRRDILGRTRDHLRGDGYLFLGSSETTVNVAEGFERVSSGRTICYQRS
ncbi:MAG TPA: protein-glutamate O-methyltransferase CheR [Acidimicrobiales bacterium]|nr:protein-glutamate O-methyltransferase CheR [Acidimicrobiales bacterium]